MSPTGAKDGSLWLSVTVPGSSLSAQYRHEIDRLRAVAVPNGAEALFTGSDQLNRDSVDKIVQLLPVVLSLVAATTFVLIFLLTGSLVLPLKALVLNTLSLSATLGALVWVFQEGHLGGLGTTATGTLVADVLVFLFATAFGLSMDYEVFLLSRIREHWLASARTRDDNAEAVALGIAGAGRVITAAALLMVIVFVGLSTGQVAFMRMIGVGLALAVVVDATLVRMVLVPAFMKLAGRWNWWIPGPLAKLHAAVGLQRGLGLRQRDRVVQLVVDQEGPGLAERRRMKRVRADGRVEIGDLGVGGEGDAADARDHSRDAGLQLVAQTKPDPQQVGEQRVAAVAGVVAGGDHQQRPPHAFDRREQFDEVGFGEVRRDPRASAQAGSRRRRSRR